MHTRVLSERYIKKNNPNKNIPTSLVTSVAQLNTKKSSTTLPLQNVRFDFPVQPYLESCFSYIVRPL